MTKKLIINADDLGICESTNEAVALAHRQGVLTSSSLMAGGPAFEHAVKEVASRNPGLSIGLHVCLTSGPSVLPANEVPLLADSRGCFRHGFVSLWRLAREPQAVEQMRREIEAQFARLHQFGVTIDHVDSHRHVHMIPAVYRHVADIALRYGCRMIRLPDEPMGARRVSRLLQTPLRTMSNLPKKVLLSALARHNRRSSPGVRSADHTYGIVDSGNVGPASLCRLALAVGRGTSEIITHPGVQSASPDPRLAPGDRAFLSSARRESELRALTQPALRQELQQAGVELITHAQLEAATDSEERTKTVRCAVVDA